jgi:2-polyprenyl-6-hydroxyphenyl methylase/3-demethylubiquinone-9 3-methyltransferase
MKLEIMQHSTIDKQEAKKFAHLAQEWWDANGKLKPLHQMNPARLSFIKEQIISHFNLSVTEHSYTPLKGVSVLDVGCGGGLVSAPIARMGADVTGIDVVADNIHIAQNYCSLHGITNAKFLQTTVEELVESGQKFKAVVCLEVVEHVLNVPLFIHCLCQLLEKNGILIISTLNRTLKSLAIAKFGAEYIANILPRGTHDWRKFITPEELTSLLQQEQTEVINLKGLKYNFLIDEWHIDEKELSINYILAAKRANSL